MRNNELESDLEDGEIREDDYEDISDCSLSEIVTVQKNDTSNLNDNADVELLREEALKSMQEKNEFVDDISEEEKYRLEALKSLLENIEIMENNDSKLENEAKKHKPRKKRKRGSKHKVKRRKKSILHTTDVVQQPDVLVKTQKTGDCTLCHLSKRNKNDKENCTVRSWYPKHESALIDTSSKENIHSQNGLLELKKSEDFIPLTVNRNTNVPIQFRQPNRVMPQQPVSTITAKYNSVPLAKSTNFKKNSFYQIHKFGLPVDSKFPSSNIKSGKYKLVKKKNYGLRKTAVAKTDFIVNKPTQSKYCINRLKCRFPLINPKEFIIDLNEEDSSKEDNSEDSIFASSASGSLENYNKDSSTDNVEKEFTKPFVKSNEKRSDVSQVEQLPHSEPQNLKVPEMNAKFHTSKNCPTILIVPANQSNSDEMKLTCSVVELKKEDVNDTPLLEKANNLPLIINEENTAAVGIMKNYNSGLLKMKYCDSGMEPPDIKVSCDNGSTIKKGNNYSAVLIDAEANLIKIREKLLSDLNQLEKITKQNGFEVEKLQNMLRKLILLKSMILKIEKKVALQKSKLSMNTSYMNSLFAGVTLRTETCSKLKEVCIRAGKSVVGPSYKPPDDFENLIMEKSKVIDFTKFAPREAK